MEGRCSVETWARFGGVPLGCKVTGGGSLVVVLSDGSEELTVFHIEEKRIVTTLQFPGPVCDLVQSDDQHLIYAACETAVYRVNIHTLMSRSPPGSAAPPSIPSVLTISPDWLAVREERVCSLLLVGSVLLTLTQNDQLWRFTLYKVLPSVASAASLHEKVAVLEVPAVSSGLYADGDQRRTPVLNCVHSGDGGPPSSASASASSLSSSSHALTGDRHFLLEPLLFKILFGVDAALSRSPVVLCGLPDGRLCSFPLRVLPPRVRVLHSLEQPVVFVGTSAAAGTGPPRRLVVVGALGRVALLEGCVSGPVVCCCVDARRLYYSTGSDLLALDLSGEGERQGAAAGGGLPSPVSLNVGSVVALAGATRHTAAVSAATEGAVQLLGLSATGKLQSIRVGQRMKDLLASIGDVCERATVLKASIHSKGEVLTHLNQVLNISCLLLSDRNKGDRLLAEKRPISCHAVSRWSRVLQTDTEFEVSLPVATDGDTPFPVAVDCSLVFSLTGLLGEEELGSLLAARRPDPGLPAGRDGGCFSLPVDTLSVDWLDAIRVCDPGPDPNEGSLPVTVDPLRAFLSGRGGGRGEDSGGPLRPGASGETFSACVRVSAELLSAALESGAADAAAGSKVAPACSSPPSVLDWLLPPPPPPCSSRGEERGAVTRGDPAHAPGNQAVVSARCPAGHPATVGEESPGEERGPPFKMLEIRVESASMAAVCGLHHAVLRRVQVSLSLSLSRSRSPLSLSGVGVIHLLSDMNMNI
ncbi:hypothetical protein NHX12_024887 [Muraenolepis orangiensis]|uniref:FA core complex associated protein 100 n=1 Tax=Muraenolepis orangiensis TaxID=630683 RepID=A0A9Q0EJ12_9TELE|nr:hypothetical protein NHX12_024887 [Muraenolepis orangiensis]